MEIRDKQHIHSIKSDLFEQLVAERAFWSYDRNTVSPENISDNELIALTMRYLDLPQINMLFSIFPTKKIKSAWQQLLVPEGEYLYTLNRFFAWYYFKAKNPDSYLKNLQTRHLKNILGA